MRDNYSKEYNFWPSITDLMVSLFVVVLTILIFSYGSFMGQVKISKDEKELLDAVQGSLQELDRRYFLYDKNFKRHVLKAEIVFVSNDSIIPPSFHSRLVEAGRVLYSKLNELQKKYKKEKLEFLIILEGTTAESAIAGGLTNKYVWPDVGYKLSYARALSLFNLWKNNGLNFRDGFQRVELIIAGSGYYGRSRNKFNESYNRRFTIQISPKLERN